MPSYVIPPAGVTAAGFFTTPTFVDPAKPPVILADNIDVNTGEVLSILVGVHPVDGAVVEAFRLQRGTGGAVEDDGSALRKIRKIGPATARQIMDECQRIMRPFVERGDVRIGMLVTEAGAPAQSFDTAAVFLTYENLRTRKGNRVPVRK